MTATSIVLLVIFAFGAGMVIGAEDHETGKHVGIIVAFVVVIIALTRYCVLHF